ncbi:variant surface antigen E isoform X1 [Ixodes scapularis]
MNNSDLEDFYHQTAEDSLPVATGGRRLPCWCRGRERAPLESLPLFQFLKDQYEADGVSARVTPASALRGLGRGRPLGKGADWAGGTSSSDTDDDMNIVQKFHKNQRPNHLQVFSQSLNSNARGRMRPPHSRPSNPRPSNPRPSNPRPSESKRSENPQGIRQRTENGWQSDIPSEGSHRNQVAQTTEQAVHSNPERSTTKEPQFWAKKTGSLPSKATNKKPSFNPAEFVGADSLECGASWANARESHSASSEDDGTDLSDEEGVTAAGKRHIGLEMCADVVERATSAVSTSSLSESSPEEVAPEGHPPPWTFKMANFPDSVTAEQISEILAPFSEVTSVVLTPGPAGVTARVTMRKCCDISWIQQCLEGTSPFGVGTSPLKISCWQEEGR